MNEVRRLSTVEDGVATKADMIDSGGAGIWQDERDVSGRADGLQGAGRVDAQLVLGGNNEDCRWNLRGDLGGIEEI